uniref:Uncharacterized protein MANES_06G128300 n=1 Tax=Rhizophora mucronata TaxID=61149 RepID=A0A2P2ISG1_RHIMU
MILLYLPHGKLIENRGAELNYRHHYCLFCSQRTRCCCEKPSFFFYFLTIFLVGQRTIFFALVIIWGTLPCRSSCAVETDQKTIFVI